MIGYYDRSGQPITLEDWASSTADAVVAKTKLGEVEVSTVWLGLDHNHAPYGPPIIFETMVFGPDHPLDMECVRYSTEAEAEAGHAAMVERVRASDG